MIVIPFRVTIIIVSMVLSAAGYAAAGLRGEACAIVSYIAGVALCVWNEYHERS